MSYDAYHDTISCDAPECKTTSGGHISDGPAPEGWGFKIAKLGNMRRGLHLCPDHVAYLDRWVEMVEQLWLEAHPNER